jgi:hypothetical protein
MAETIINGYYVDNTHFYSDSALSLIITPATDTTYMDIPSEKYYTWNGSAYLAKDAFKIALNAIDDSSAINIGAPVSVDVMYDSISAMESAAPSVVSGYYVDTTHMYTDAANTVAIVPSTDNTYRDISTSKFYTWSGTAYTEIAEPSVVCFVKNTNSASTDNVSYPERGAFYKYDWEKLRWQLIILGTHSHADPHLLDELDNIDTQNLNTGDKKILILTKTDPDKTVDTYDYTLSWTNLADTNVPAAPVLTDETARRYLTANKDGTLSWTNELLPLQTSHCFSIEVSSDFMDSTLPGKRLRIPETYRALHKFYFDPDYDTALVFDDGRLLYNSTVTVEYLCDCHGIGCSTTTSTCDCATSSTCTNCGTPDKTLGYNILISITDKDVDHTFSIGEKINVVVLRNGLAGAFQSIKDTYVTKDELAQYDSKGVLSLKGYVTEEALDTKLKRYALLSHTHDNYLLKTDYDAFDWRYAPYYHTHPDYITRVELDSILTGTASVTDDTIKNDLSTMQTNITSLVDAKIAKAISGIQTDTNASGYIVDIGSEQKALAPYLVSLSDRIDNIDYTAIPGNATLSGLSSNITVELGDNDPRTGLIIASGDTIEGTLNKLLRVSIAPTLTQPTLIVERVLDADHTQFDGEMTSVKIKTAYTANDGGSVKSYTCTLKGYDGTILETKYVTEDSQEFTFSSRKLGAGDTTGLCGSVDVTVVTNSEDAAIKYSNTDTSKAKPYTLGSLTITKTVKLYVVPKIYYGALAYTLTDTDVVSNKIVDNLSKLNYFIESNILNNVYNVDLDSLDNTAKLLVFAFPTGISHKVKAIINMSQGYNMIAPDYTVQIPTYMLKHIEDTVDIHTDTTSALDGYTIYYLQLKHALESDAPIKLMFTTTD